jgi:hypothetical protein
MGVCAAASTCPLKDPLVGRCAQHARKKKKKNYARRGEVKESKRPTSEPGAAAYHQSKAPTTQAVKADPAGAE